MVYEVLMVVVAFLAGVAAHKWALAILAKWEAKLKADWAKEFNKQQPVQVLGVAPAPVLPPVVNVQAPL